MVHLLKKCIKCGNYTLMSECPRCGFDVKLAYPPKFSLDDKYWKLRYRGRFS